MSSDPMRLEVKQVQVKAVHDPSIVTDQWCAVVYVGKRKRYRSAGCHYSMEARRAGLFWMDLQRHKAVPADRKKR